MINISQEKINEIRNSVDIVDVISRYLNVVRKGKNYFALCPFHNDNNPSLSISREKQIYKCFVCNEGGNAITFVQKYKNISFVEALKEVAEIGGISFDYKISEKSNIPIHIQRQYDLLKDCALFYQNALASNEQALSYVKSRNFDKKTLYEFKIGYSLDSEKLIKFLKSKKYTDEEILKSGIAIENNGNLYDRFAHRLIFPITDLNGRIIAFSGRIIEKNELAKYVNSPETEIFIKGNTFYHYFDALPSIKKNKMVYICEGFMDVIALFKSGIDNAIALMGTAFTKEHLKVLKFLGVKVILTLDGDKPGNLAAYKLSQELDNLNIQTEVVSSYLDVKDLDEFLNKYGSEQLLQHINKSMNFFDYYLYFNQKELNFENFETKKKFANQISKYLAKKDEFEQDEYLKKLNQIGFPKHTIKNLIAKYSDEKNQIIKTTYAHNKNLLSKYQKIQIIFMLSLLNSEEAVKYFLNDLIYLPDERYRILANYIADYYVKNHDLNIANLYSTEDENINKTLNEVLNAFKDLPKYNQDSFKSLVYNIKECIPLEEKINALKEELNYMTDNQKRAEKSQEIINLKAELKRKMSNGGSKYEEKN